MRSSSTLASLVRLPDGAERFWRHQIRRVWGRLDGAARGGAWRRSGLYFIFLLFFSWWRRWCPNDFAGMTVAVVGIVVDLTVGTVVVVG
ncbi:uncharacterized protein M6B38_348275 [Iris pallida]|uniref:Uncharacterized protein n=1 Tax=Iris pallida TaxID=29817 RepID=A0AAX6GSQ9_IRIPA|nr:uncharacterized protein M6B38_348275 [Iris pallida]